MVVIKTPQQIEGIRRSSRLAAQTLAHTARYVEPGISTQALNDIAHHFIISHSATPAPLNYGGFPKSICTSVNNVVCHGIPSKTEILRAGDIINIDVTTILDGYYGDVSATYPVGRISTQAQDLLARVRQSLTLAIASVKPGKSLNDCVGAVIDPYLSKFGYAVVRDLGGHGVGLQFHEDPFVFHFNNPQVKLILQPGMVFTIEPMINASKN